jgi:N-acetylmuramoyl-L-alanine amidase
MKLSILLFFLAVMFTACSPTTKTHSYRYVEVPEALPSSPSKTIPVQRPSPPPPEIKKEKPIAMVDNLVVKQDRVIVIDPGHGGEDLGTNSTSPQKYQEKFLNLTTSMMLKRYLNQMGYKTVMTRTKDIFIPLNKRASIANNQNPTLFVSVHFNSAPSKQAEGVEVYFYRSENDKIRSKKSQDLAQQVLDNILVTTQAKSRGVKHGNFAVIRETNMPAILVEGGFLTNETEMQKIKDPAYLKRIAWGIAQGIHSYLN